jgi:hypothetical protein
MTYITEKTYFSLFAVDPWPLKNTTGIAWFDL